MALIRLVVGYVAVVDLHGIICPPGSPSPLLSASCSTRASSFHCQTFRSIAPPFSTHLKRLTVCANPTAHLTNLVHLLTVSPPGCGTLLVLLFILDYTNRDFAARTGIDFALLDECQTTTTKNVLVARRLRCTSWGCAFVVRIPGESRGRGRMLVLAQLPKTHAWGHLDRRIKSRME